MQCLCRALGMTYLVLYQKGAGNKIYPKASHMTSQLQSKPDLQGVKVYYLQQILEPPRSKLRLDLSRMGILVSSGNSQSRPKCCKAESKCILRAEGFAGSLFSSTSCGKGETTPAKGCISHSLLSTPCPLMALPC